MCVCVCGEPQTETQHGNHQIEISRSVGLSVTRLTASVFISWLGMLLGVDVRVCVCCWCAFLHFLSRLGWTVGPSVSVWRLHNSRVSRSKLNRPNRTENHRSGYSGFVDWVWVCLRVVHRAQRDRQTAVGGSFGAFRAVRLALVRFRLPWHFRFPLPHTYIADSSQTPGPFSLCWEEIGQEGDE